MDTAATTTETKHSRVLINRALQLLVDSIQSDDAVVHQFKDKFINPLFTQMYPYFLILVVMLCVLFIVNFTCCLFVITSSCRRR
jgi:hypothetical protein